MERLRVPIVGIGASAGGLPAITELLGEAEADDPAAYVIVQHLSTDHPMMLHELLDRRLSLPVVLADGTTPIRAGCCYVAPAGTLLRVEGERFRLDAAEPAALRASINTFFHSLAADRGSEAVAVILSGTGEDGSEGAEAIHRAGGLVFAQAPESAEFAQMPQGVIRRGVVARALPPAELFRALVRTAKFSSVRPPVDQVTEVIREHGGDISGYTSRVVERRIERRMMELGMTDAASFAARLADQPDERSGFVRSLSVDVTEFFRNPTSFEYVRTQVLPQLIERKPDEELRVWSAGCASGQEAYSIGMILAETLGQGGFRVFATDTSATALERAGRGFYTNDAMAGVSEARRAAHFVAEDEGYRVREQLRERIVFAAHDLHRDPPFSHVDLILCRNVLIYFRKDARRRVMSAFHFALNPGGALFLGDSESAADGFEATAPKEHRVFRRVAHSWRHGGAKYPPFSSRLPTSVSPPVVAARSELLDAYAPAAALVSPDGSVEHLFGDTAPFLTLSSGRLSRNIGALARGPLGGPLAAVIRRARRTNAPANFRGLTLDSVQGTVSLLARPLGDSGRLIVCFEVHEGAEVEATSGGEHLAELHSELLDTRQNLQSAVEELQSSNDELQASNEEMLAANEELHATNEELYSLSAERAMRVQELSQLNDDVRNLLNATGVGTIFLDEQLRIRRVVGPVGDFFGASERDIGRHIGDFRGSLRGVDLLELATKVWDTQSALDSDTGYTERARVLVRGSVYRSSDASLSGVVVTFVDVTPMKQAQERLRCVLDSLPQHVALIDEQGHLQMVNASWRRFAEQQGAEVKLGVNYLSVTAQDPDADGVLEGLTSVLRGDSGGFATQYPCDTPNEPLRFRLDVTPMAVGGGVQGAVVSHLDITEQVLAQQAQMRSAEAFERLFEDSSTPLLVVEGARLHIRDANEAAATMLRRPRSTIIGASLETLVPQERVSVWQQTLSALPERGETVRPLEIIDGDGLDQAVAVSFYRLEHRSEQAALVELRGAGASQPGPEVPGESIVPNSRRLEALGTLAGGVAHETNNVLAGVMSLLDGHADDARIPAALRQDLRDAMAACHRGRDITRQLLGFSRADSVTEPVDIAELFEEVGRALGALVPANVSLRISAAKGCVVDADRSLLSQALLNLAINGIDAMRKGGGTLALRLRRRDDGDYELRVSDTGGGMPRAVRARAFEPFFTTKARGEGTGLGLPMVYGVVRALRGVIDVESETGKGTTIRISLPPSTKQQESPEANVEPPSLRGRALVIDDDRLVRRGVARMLRRVGMHVDDAEDGPSGLAALEREEYSLVVLDIVMPEMDGWQVLARIRERDTAIPVLIHSGYAENADMGTHIEDKRVAFAYKPLSLQEMASSVHALMAPMASLER